MDFEQLHSTLDYCQCYFYVIIKILEVIFQLHIGCWIKQVVGDVALQLHVGNPLTGIEIVNWSTQAVYFGLRLACTVKILSAYFICNTLILFLYFSSVWYYPIVCSLISKAWHAYIISYLCSLPWQKFQHFSWFLICHFYFFGVCELELNDPKEEDSHFKGTIIHKTDVGRGIHAWRFLGSFKFWG